MTRTFSDVACPVCSCLCDDLRVTVADGRVTSAERACHLARPWFESLSKPCTRPAAIAEGRGVSLDDAIQHAADILRASRKPLIWGLSRSSTEGQRAAVFLAEQLGATIDTEASLGESASILALQQVGQSTCTLGEVRNRADLVIFWGADPVATHPRHLERYCVDPAGIFVPQGRADRHVIVIDRAETATSQLADEFVRIRPGDDAAAIAALRQIVNGGGPADKALSAETLSISRDELQRLADRMRVCRYGAVFYGPRFAGQADGMANVESLFQLVRELNAHARFTARGLRSTHEVVGADGVLCWLTGFPFAVSFAAGYPRFDPDAYSANQLLERGEVDACLFVGSSGVRALSSAAREHVSRVPTIALDYPNAPQRVPEFAPTVEITTAIYGIHAAGTANRMDDVTIPLWQLVPTDLPTDEVVLKAIRERVVSLSRTR